MSTKNAAAVTIDLAVLGQLAYHVNRVAVTAGEDGDACVTHAALSWALLNSIGEGELAALIDELDLPDVGTAAGSEMIQRRAGHLALQLCSHFTSEGQHELAGLYHDAYQRIVAAS
jgi:hypothetical protein